MLCPSGVVVRFVRSILFSASVSASMLTLYSSLSGYRCPMCWCPAMYASWGTFSMLSFNPQICPLGSSWCGIASMIGRFMFCQPVMLVFIGYSW